MCAERWKLRKHNEFEEWRILPKNEIKTISIDFCMATKNAILNISEITLFTHSIDIGAFLNEVRPYHFQSELFALFATSTTNRKRQK